VSGYSPFLLPSQNALIPFHPYLAPPTTSRSGQKNNGKRERTTYDKQSLDFLEAEFQIGHYPDAVRKESIARHLGLEEGKIQIWFKNRRAKMTSQKKQFEKMDKLRSSTESTPSASSADKSSPPSKLDCSPDSTTWVKKEEPSARSPTSTSTVSLAFPTVPGWPTPDATISNPLSALSISTSSFPSSLAPAWNLSDTVMGDQSIFPFPPMYFPVQAATSAPTLNSTDSTVAQNYALQYPAYYPHNIIDYYNNYYYPNNYPNFSG
ncbi:hypothetical protein PFISCL1PPCAC_23870, partial [Pristionchus fissidentatus]